MAVSLLRLPVLAALVLLAAGTDLRSADLEEDPVVVDEYGRILPTGPQPQSTIENYGNITVYRQRHRLNTNDGMSGYSTGSPATDAFTGALLGNVLGGIVADQIGNRVQNNPKFKKWFPANPPVNPPPVVPVAPAPDP